MTAEPLTITRWASQASRDPAALAVRLDPRGFADLVAEAAHLAAHVPFIGDDGQPHGSWQEVLAADPAIVLALLATLDVTGRTGHLQALLHHARTARSPAAREDVLRQMLRALLRLAREIDAWLAPAESAAGLHGDAVRRQLESSIETVLAPRLRALLADAAAIDRTGLLADLLIAEAPGERWRLQVIEADLACLEQVVEHEIVDRLLLTVSDVAEAFVRQLGAISAAAVDAGVDAGLAGTATHAPHIALILAFARLFAHAQDRLNDIPGRIVDYYHQDILRQRPRGASPDRVFLTLQPQPLARPHVPAGASFPAGKGADGKPILFTADAALTVTGATVTRARIWRAARGDGAAGPRVGVTELVAKDGVFGDGASGLAASAPLSPASPALIVAAPALALASGIRRIRIVLACKDETLPEGLGACLAVSVSSAKGWIAVPGATIDITGQTIGLTILLDAQAPPIAPCPDGPPMPAVRLAVNPSALTAALPLSLIAGIALDDVTVSVAVKGLGGVEIADPAAFGTPPHVGGSLRLDSPIFRSTPLHRLAIGLTWTSVPADRYGFAGYYSEYVVDADRRISAAPLFDNGSFGVRIDAPVRGWDGGAHVMPLFATGTPAPSDVFVGDGDFLVPSPIDPPRRTAPVSPTSWFAIGGIGAEEVDAPDHVLVTLATPDNGFGDAIYPINIAHATAILAHAADPPRRPGWLERFLKQIAAVPIALLVKLHLKAPPALPPPPPAPRPLPNPPWRPILAGVSIDYAAHVGAADGDDAPRLFQDVPLEGLRSIDRPAGAALVPALPARLSIDIALAGASPGDALSLFARMGSGAVGGAPAWLCRTQAGWSAITLAEDGTNGLATTGIVTLVIPGDARIDPDGAIWLRIVPPGDAPVPPVLSIVADALTATRLIVDPAAPLPPVAAGTIARLPGIARVAQPLAASGGRAPEAPSDRRRRVSERVRHRGRAVRGWDVERLVLSEFPEIAKVRVLPASGDGAVTIIVLPVRTDETDPIRPRAPADLRGRIGAHLKERASPFADIRVVDPDYATLMISGDVRVRPDGVDALTRDVAAFLSPWTEPGLALDDHMGPDELRASIAGFLLRQPYVVAIDRLAVTLDDPSGGWRVPAIGAIDLVAVIAS